MRDVAYLLDAMYGPDQHDNYTLAQLGRTPPEGYTAYLTTKTSLKGMRLGIPWNPYWSTNAVSAIGYGVMLGSRLIVNAQAINTPGQRVLYESRLQELKDAGAEIYNLTVSL